MLDEDEYAFVFGQGLREWMSVRGPGVSPVKSTPSGFSGGVVADRFRAITGEDLPIWNELGVRRRALYGDPCAACGKPLRSSRARFCAACGEAASAATA